MQSFQVQNTELNMEDTKTVWRLPGIFLAVNFLFLFVTSKVLKIDANVRYQLLLVQYLILAETLFVLLSRSLYNRIVDKWPRQTKVGLILRMLLAPVFILGQSLMLLHLILVAAEPKLLSLLTGYSFGLIMYLMGVIIVLEVLYHVTVVVRNRSAAGFSSLFTNRRSEAQERLFIGVTLLLSCICFYVGIKNCTFPEVVRVRIPIKNLPVSFNNTVIVQLSDMHIGILNGRTSLEKAVKVANSLKPDIVAITGDTAEGGVNKLRRALQPLEQLKAKYGVYITTGNHDYYTAEVDKLIELWKSIGLVVLHNSKHLIKNKQNDFLQLAGIDDTEGKFFRGEDHGPHYDKALQGRDPNVPTILLSHRPSVCKKAMTEYGNIQLALSGHTHGGQFPISGLFHYLSEPYFCGLYQFDRDSYVYVSTGVFYWAAPLRLFHKGEISHITLISA